MMYKQGFAIAIKCEGKILREYDEVVKLPFGSEYSIILKNKENRSAVVSVEVDGKLATCGRLIVSSGQSVELEGFMDGMVVRNKFKFIEKTKDIENYRGNFIDDGTIHVKYQFEKEVGCKKPAVVYGSVDHSDWGNFRYAWLDTGDSHVFGCSTKSLVGSTTIKSNACFSHTTNEDGITVKGSKTNQDFVYGSTKPLENFHRTMTLKLKGYKRGSILVEKPITIKTKLACPTCGRKWKSSYEFCGKCGTFLN